MILKILILLVDLPPLWSNRFSLNDILSHQEKRKHFQRLMKSFLEPTHPALLTS